MISTIAESWQTIQLPGTSGRRFLITVSQGTIDPWLTAEIPLLMEGKDGVPLTSSPYASVRRFENPETKEVFYYKEFHDRGIMDTMKKQVLPSRARKSFRAGHLLLRQGFRTPAPILYGEEKRSCLIMRNFLVTAAVDAETTYDYFRTHFAIPLSQTALAEKWDLLDKAGTEIGRLHRQGIFHGDLRVGNIIIRSQGLEAELFLVDNERTRRYDGLPERKRLKNLVQLNLVNIPEITGTDRMRFLRAYLRENRELFPRKKELISAVLRLTKGRIRKRNMRRRITL